MMASEIGFIIVSLVFLGFGCLALLRPDDIQNLYMRDGQSPKFYGSANFRRSLQVTGVALMAGAAIALLLTIGRLMAPK
jgi:hypothetical protein